MHSSLSLGALRTLVTCSGTTVARIMDSNINTQGCRSKPTPLSTQAKMMSRETAKQSCPEM